MVVQGLDDACPVQWRPLSRRDGASARRSASNSSRKAGTASLESRRPSLVIEQPSAVRGMPGGGGPIPHRRWARRGARRNLLGGRGSGSSLVGSKWRRLVVAGPAFGLGTAKAATEGPRPGPDPTLAGTGVPQPASHDRGAAGTLKWPPLAGHAESASTQRLFPRSRRRGHMRPTTRKNEPR